ncbi:MAG: apolipoprotein N-acyltransferase [Gammaproteobacteria bacterium]|nr:apolipoprotein N-acyltransferase [Gammaproteobacteria bacterium]
MKITLPAYLIAIAAGLALPFAFAPFGYYPLAILVPALLMFLWLNATPRQAFSRGWLFGLGFFGLGVYWIFISIHQFGEAPVWLALLITALLVMFLALYIAINGYLITQVFKNNSLTKFLLAFPASWVLFEWLRGYVITGFPWLYLGYSQISSPLRGVAPILGVYGVSFVCVLLSGAIVALWAFRKKFFVEIFILLMCVLIWFGSSYLTKISWTKADSKTIKVSLVQGNIPLEQKWNSKQILPILRDYYLPTSKHWDSKIIVWPEAAIPTFSFEIQMFLKGLDFQAKLHQATILSGIPVYNAATKQYFNGMLALGKNHGTYLKRHLVPFGEFVPFKSYLGWIGKFVIIPMSGFSSGPEAQPDLFADDILVAPFICYEIAYPYLVLDYLPKALLLVTISEDSWFGRSFAAMQQLEISRMRSLETGRYQLVSTNTGMTAIINPHGKIVSIVPKFKPEVLTAEIRAMHGKTPWVSYGKNLWWLLMLISIFIALIRENKKNR